MLIILLGFVWIFADSVIQSRDEKLARAGRDSENMAQVLDEQINGVIQKAGILLEHIADEAIAKPGEKTLTQKELGPYLKKLKASIPEMLSIRIIKPDGHSRADSKENNSSPYYGDRTYFIRHRDNSSLELGISEPIFGRTNKVWQIMVTRRLNNPDGSFAGIVSSAIALSNFEKLFSSLNLGKHSNITLVSKDLYIVTRFPISEEQRMKSLRGGLIAAALLKNPHEGRFSGKSIVDGVDRVYSYRQVGELPLIVVVGQSKQEVLAEWRRNALIDGTVIVGLILAIALLVHNLLQRYKQEQESEARLREVTANLGEGVYVLDKNGMVTFVNPEAEKLLGWDAKDLVGKDGHNSFHYKTPDGTPISSNECPVHKTIRTGQVFRSQDDWLVRKDGTVIPVSIVSSPVVQNNQITGSVAAFQDISQRLEAERTLRESEERFRLISASANDAIIIIGPTEEITYWNPAAEAIFGYKADEALGQNLHHLLAPTRHHDDSRRGFEHFRMSGEGALIGKTLEIIALRKNGEEFPIELSISAFRIKSQWHALGIIRDISERKKAEQEYKTIIQTTMDGYLVVDAHAGRFLDVNDAYCKMLGYSREEILCMRTSDIEAMESPERVKQHTEQIRNMGCAQFETRHRRKDGRIIDVEISATYLDIRGGVFIVFIRDISERKKAEEQIRQLAYYDTLTSLPNRRLLLDRLNQSLVQAKRYQRAVAVMFLDLDRFKLINDTLGHDAGDELLKEVATRLNACVRSGDTVSRQGGDEFVIVLAEIAHAQDAALVAEKIIGTLGQPISVKGHELQITTSIGIAIFPVNGTDDARELMKKADTAMYAAKEAGRNGYRFC